MLDRKEEHLATGNRPSATAHIRAGVAADGKLTAFDAQSWGTGGAGHFSVGTSLQNRANQLGVLAALTGIILAVAASWALAAMVFHVKYVFFVAPLLIAVGLVLLLTMGIGMLIGRGVAKLPPLELLRMETGQ